MSMRVVVILAAILKMADGHGRLREPPSRSSMWRDGYNNPPNYNDNQLYCGGFPTQYEKNGGKCGVCGDPYDGPLENEGPDGKYAKNGIIVRKYDAGQILHTNVHITANHKGFFQFKICRNDVVTAKVTQECFDQNVLADLQGNTELHIGSVPAYYNHSLRLPVGLTCAACVLQWRYHTANSWGTDPDTKKGCIGCGNQEEFYGCADIAIGENVAIDKPSNPTVKPDNDQNGNKPCNCPCSKSVPLGSSGHLMLLALVFAILKAWVM